MTSEESLTQFLRLRGVNTPCEKCRGLGVYHYSSGSTWRGGMGTCAFQWDICDVCWSTGDKYRIGTDIRELEAQRKKWQEDQILEYLAYRLGCGLSRISQRVLQLSDLCEKQANRRKLPEGEEAFWWNSEWHALGRMLRKLVNKDENF
jgi:hypothetical protein